jgi:tetratricopeptide (TPR) repeat protein
VAQEKGPEAEEAFFSTLTDIPEDKVATWRGLSLYRQGRMTEAAEQHERAVSLRPGGSARISALLNAASAHMEAGDLGRASLLTEEGLRAANTLRHTELGSRAEILLRGIHNRSGGTDNDPELVDIINHLPQSVMSGILLIVGESCDSADESIE